MQGTSKDVFCKSQSQPMDLCYFPWDPIQQYKCERDYPVQADFILFKYLDDDDDTLTNDIILYNFRQDEYFYTSSTYQIDCYFMKMHPTGNALAYNIYIDDFYGHLLSKTTFDNDVYLLPMEPSIEFEVIPKRELKSDVNMYIWWENKQDIPKDTSTIIFRIDIQDDEKSFTMMDNLQDTENIPVDIYIFRINDFARRYSTKRFFDPNNVLYETLSTTEDEETADEYLFHTETLNYVYTT